MKSLIKNSNSYKIPFGIILLFVFIYICSNIRFLSIGENSFSPIFIFLFGYSFFAYFIIVDNIKLSTKLILNPIHRWWMDAPTVHELKNRSSLGIH